MRIAIVGVVVLALGVSLIVMHPSFAAMRIIAAHNGGMGLGILGPMWSLVLACFVAVASLIPLLRAWRRDPAAHVMYKYMIAYGAAIVSLCLLQMALRYVGFGSEYAVKNMLIPWAHS
jgi:hypothetical protein